MFTENFCGKVVPVEPYILLSKFHLDCDFLSPTFLAGIMFFLASICLFVGLSVYLFVYLKNRIRAQSGRNIVL